MKSLRVARLIDVYGKQFVGGGQTHVRELSQALESYDCRSVLFSQSNPHIIFRFLWSWWVIVAVVLRHFISPFQVVHSHGFIAGFSAKMVSLMLHIPVVHSIHGTPNMEQHTGGFMERLENFLLLGIPYDAQITDGKKFLEFKSKTQSIVYIPNGVNTSLDKKDKLEMRQKTENIRFITVARLVQEKGMDILLKAVAGINNPKINVCILGEGPLEAALKVLAKQLKIDKQVRWMGVKKGKAYKQALSEADLFILPSLAEGQPISLLDAWAAKLPVVVSAVGNNPYMVTVGKNGWLVKPGSVKALQETLKLALSQQSQWVKMGEQGYNLVKTTYSWDITAKKVFEVYQRVINRKE